MAGTEVITGINANGSYSTTQIQDIAVGQDVLTRNANDPNGPLQEEAVTAVQVHTVYSLRLVNVKLADGTTETIDTTDSHPFYVQGQGFVSAEDLQAGEQLATPDGQSAMVLGTSSEAEANGVQVYNFTVANDHTYFVEPATGGAGATPGTLGVDALWVHNNCFGQWVPADQGAWSQAARDYQEQITGHAGEAFLLNGVKFDGFDAEAGTLLEAKFNYSQFLGEGGNWQPWSRGGAKLAEQAEAQVEAANGVPIVWHVAEEDVAATFRDLYEQAGKLTVQFTPPD